MTYLEHTLMKTEFDFKKYEIRFRSFQIVFHFKWSRDIGFSAKASNSCHREQKKLLQKYCKSDGFDTRGTIQVVVNCI